MKVIDTEVEGFKLVGYHTGAMRPAHEITIRGRRPQTITVPAEPDWRLGVLQLRAFPPVFDFEGDECVPCAAKNIHCDSRHGLRAQEVLPLALLAEDGSPLPTDAVIASAGLGAVDTRFLYVIGQRATSDHPPTVQDHPHGYGIHFFRSMEDIERYRNPTPAP